MPIEIAIIIQYCLIPTATLLPVLWCYALALNRGLVFARDDQHRLAPISPWSLFWMGGRTGFRRLCLCLPICCLLVSPIQDLFFVWYEVYLETMPQETADYFQFWLGWIILDYSDGEALLFTIHDWAQILGSLGIAMTAMTLLGPRLGSPSRLAAIGALVLAPALWFLLWEFEVLFPYPAGKLPPYPMFGLQGVLLLAAAWYRARYFLDRRWFRFPEG